MVNDTNFAPKCIRNNSALDLQYTFHVGEEFRDIISGLRAIVEAVIFLNLKNEDRLGHAVALGIDPELFLLERKKISMSRGEYFDNLVFMYFLLGYSEQNIVKREMLKDRINRLAYEIYEDFFEKGKYDADDFVDAWLLRRNCPIQLYELYEKIDTRAGNTSVTPPIVLKKTVENNPDILAELDLEDFQLEYTFHALPDFFKEVSEDELPLKRYLTAQNNSNALTLYWGYCTNEKVHASYERPYNNDAGFTAEVYEYFQDIVMEQFISKRDIVIEILPTSNMLITPLNTYSKHPFLRFNPPGELQNRFGIRSGKLKIVIGTDDPGIQGTNLIMELYLVKQVVEMKYDKKIAEEYIRKLCEFSEYLFEKGSR